jgi:dTDP-4-amino-4,6-dideoxygalactose transaminase
MRVFNSLGSNYNSEFVFSALFSKNDVKYSSELKSYLENKYHGKAILLYKGREAVKLALDLMNLPKNSHIAINSLTCYAVYKAINDAGHKAVYLDTRPLNFSPSVFEAKLKEDPKVKAVIIQNTLGFPCNISEIEKTCKKREIILIEDLAHSIGAFYTNGKEAGTVGDFAVFSFSQDKLVDGISGGALVARNKKYQNFNSLKLDHVENAQQAIDKLYPLFTYIIRTTYQSGFGKILHLALKKMNLLSKPMGDEDPITAHSLPYWYCNLINRQFKGLQNNLGHRKNIALIYARSVNSKITLSTNKQQIEQSTDMRFPILTTNRNSLIKHLKRYGIYISDIWYDAPIAPKKYLASTDYDYSCPESEKISSQLLNLPTHKNVSVSQAKYISERVNQWLDL